MAVHSRSWQIQLEAGASEDFVICPALSGAWYNPETPGQGVFLDISQTPALLFAGWFSWNAAGERDWFTAQGSYAEGDDAASMTLSLTTGGRFDDPAPVVHTAAGQSQLRFFNCESAELEYSFDDGPAGVIPLRRLVQAPGDCADACRR